jgi:gliding motility-associated-like protein
MKRAFLLAILFVGLWSVEARSQNILKNTIYRIIAFKRGNNLVVSQSNYKEIVPPLRMYIPSAFTPNGDGLNDRFGVKGEGLATFRMLVYDRWGEVIFESDDAAEQWDGSFKGQPVQQGTYVYQVFTPGDNRGSRTGSVTLIR